MQVNDPEAVGFTFHHQGPWQIEVITSRPFLKNGGRYCLGSVAVSAVPADVLPYISVAIKASFLKLGMCNICKTILLKCFWIFF